MLRLVEGGKRPSTAHLLSTLERCASKEKILSLLSLLSLKPPHARKRPQRGRISITAGEESEANVTCGFSQKSRQDVLEEGEQKQAVNIPHMFALFLLWQATKWSARAIARCASKEKNIVPIVSIVFKTSASKERKEWGKWSLRSLVISH